MLTLDLLPTQVQADRICPPPGGGSLLLVAMDAETGMKVSEVVPR